MAGEQTGTLTGEGASAASTDWEVDEEMAGKLQALAERVIWFLRVENTKQISNIVNWECCSLQDNKALRRGRGFTSNHALGEADPRGVPPHGPPSRWGRG